MGIGRGGGARVVAVVLPVLLSMGRPAAAQTCGGAVRESVTLTGDVSACPGSGLRVLGSAVLDCAGHEISGSGEGEGILLDRAEGAEVRNCVVTGFRTGIRIRGGGANVVANSEVRGSERYGIELAVATRDNRIAGVTVTGSGDEGIHVGAGADDNEIVDGVFADNGRENVYLLSVRGVSVVGNRISGARSAAIYMKHAVDTLVADNVIIDRPVHVRGTSTGNVFLGNSLSRAGFVFEAYRDGTRWTSPRENDVREGSVRGAAVCFRFAGAQDNTVANVAVDGCRRATQVRTGGIAAVRNTVRVVPID